jgi:hypothetical protein
MLNVGNTNIVPLRKLAELFGGRIYSQVRGAPRRPFWVWTLPGAQAASALRQMLPWLTVKQPEAEVALAFAETIQPRNGKIVPLEVRELRSEMYQRLRDLKTGAV